MNLGDPDAALRNDEEDGKMSMPSLGVWRLDRDAVLEFDVVEPLMPEDVVAARIREADVVEGPSLMSKAMSKDGQVARKDRRVDDTLAEVVPMLSKMSADVM